MAISGTTDNAVYNSRIAGMLTPSFFRRSRFVLIFPILLLAATARGQNWTGAEEQLAAKIVAVTGQRTMAVEVSNRASLAQFPSATSDLNAATVDEIRRGLLTQLAASGARFVNIEQAAATVRIALSESLQNYVWVAEIRLGADSASNPASNQSSNQASSVEPVVVMVSWPRAATRTTEPEAAPMALHKTSLWSQPERILDVVVVDGNPARMVVLDARGVTSYLQRDGRWQSEQSFAVAHSRPWPRDLRGRIELRKDHLLDVYLPGVFCRSTTLSPLAMSCSEGDNMWPIGTSVFNLNAAFVPSRNYFGGALLPGVGKQMATVPVLLGRSFSARSIDVVALRGRGRASPCSGRNDGSGNGKFGMGKRHRLDQERMRVRIACAGDGPRRWAERHGSRI